MTLLPSLFLRRGTISRLPNPCLHASAAIAIMLCLLACPCHLRGQAAVAAPDVLVLINGDTLHGKLVSEVGGTVTFHSDPLGDISLSWDKIKELHTSNSFAVLKKDKVFGKKNAASIPTGTIEVANQSLTLHPENTAALATIPIADAQYIIDKGTLDKQLYHHPGFFTGWNGAATAGASVVAATQNQYAFSGAIGFVRVVPTVTWLSPRNRTSVDFTGSFGKITEPAYTIPATTIVVPAVVTKSALYHADAERDEYFSPRFFALAQTAFDHNYAQNLDLQQIYGGGVGYTVLKTPHQEADVKATIQYARQAFISDSAANKNLIGSTFSADYVFHNKLLTYTQSVAYIPAYNDPHAYSVNQANTLAFPAYKNFSLSMGTLDSYLNGPPATLPPTKRNSFQFTMGVTYVIKSKY